MSFVFTDYVPVIWTRKVPSLFNTVSQDETPKWGMKLGPRMDASGYPQRAYVKRWVLLISLEKVLIDVSQMDKT